MNKYIFESERLGFRTWLPSDLVPMAALNADAEVMRHFPGTQSIEQTKAFLSRMNEQFDQRGYCYFAVDLLEQESFIGFIGLSYQSFDIEQTPFVDIGWRLARMHWGNGYATEGARKCLRFGFEQLRQEKIYAVATSQNKASINVMEKVGMTYVADFEHPTLRDYPQLRSCVLYKSQRPSGIMC